MTQEVTRVGPQGRVVIPAGVRRAMGIVEGDALVLRLEGGRLVVERRAAVLERLVGRWEMSPSEGDAPSPQPAAGAARTAGRAVDARPAVSPSGGSVA